MGPGYRVSPMSFLSQISGEGSQMGRPRSRVPVPVSSLSGIIIKQLFRESVSFNRYLKLCPCYDVLIVFSFINCCQFSGFLNNSVMLYPKKLKTGMLSRMNDTFGNTVF